MGDLAVGTGTALRRKLSAGWERPPARLTPRAYSNSSCAYSTTISIKDRTLSLQFLKAM
jgi:hypothetical protein